MKKIALFASGSGTNVENIIKYFNNNRSVEVSIILTNNANAFVLERAKNHSISSYIFNKHEFYNTDNVLKELKQKKIDLIVLAGFMWLVPENLINNFNSRIINIHPALLPKYGGKGMYGDYVHKAVIANGENESGITIHYVNNVYDDGEIIFQAKCLISSEDNPESLAKKIHSLEYEHYPPVIEKLLLKK
ncbi:MAG: phosphoribosylglycinamide formyltransferase [Bacteroidales bacterium]|nr:phosphoribosylglycinamide formyltransferase [Bacteroidales bacterium]